MLMVGWLWFSIEGEAQITIEWAVGGSSNSKRIMLTNREI
jgi:hypothetical protein